MISTVDWYICLIDRCVGRENPTRSTEDDLEGRLGFAGSGTTVLLRFCRSADGGEIVCCLACVCDIVWLLQAVWWTAASATWNYGRSGDCLVAPPSACRIV